MRLPQRPIDIASSTPAQHLVGLAEGSTPLQGIRCRAASGGVGAVAECGEIGIIPDASLFEMTLLSEYQIRVQMQLHGVSERRQSLSVSSVMLDGSISAMSYTTIQFDSYPVLLQNRL
jgi:hypothetical protein